MLYELLDLNTNFKLNLSIKEVNYVLEFNETDKNNLSHIEASSFEYYKNEFLASKLLICICNKHLDKYNQITNQLKESSLNISLIAAKHLTDNETLIECLKTLKSISIGSPIFYGPLTEKIFKIFNI